MFIKDDKTNIIILQLLSLIFVLKTIIDPFKTKPMTMQTRLNEFKVAVAALSVSDVQNATNFQAWCDAWANYVQNDSATSADRPPVKPHHG